MSGETNQVTETQSNEVDTEEEEEVGETQAEYEIQYCTGTAWGMHTGNSFEKN